MPNRVFSYLDLPELDIENGASLPDPGGEGLTVFSTREQRLLVWNGGAWRFVGHNDARLLYGISDFTTPSYFATAAGGGEPGVITGYGIATLLCILQRPTSWTTFTSRCLEGNSGWSHLSNTTGGIIYQQVGNGNSSIYSLVNNDLNRIMMLVGVYNATTGRVTQFVNGREISTGSYLGLINAPASVPQVWGSTQQTGYVAPNALFLGQLAYRGMLTAAQMKYLHDYTRGYQSLPTTIPGATVTHRWFVRDMLENRAVVTGQVAPASITDTATNAASDTLVRAGTNTKIRVRDLGGDGAREYGITQFSAYRVLRTMPSKGILSNSTGFWCACLITPRPYTVTYNTLATAGRIDSQVYWNLQTIWNRKFNFQIITPGLTLIADSADNIMGAADYHQKRLVVAYFDGTNAYINYEGNNIATLAMTAIPTAPIDGVFFLGAGYDGSNPCVDNTMWGAAGGKKAITLAEVQALHAYVKATGRIQAIPGKTDSLWDFTKDLGETTYVLPSNVTGADVDSDFPLWSLDRVGNANLRAFGGFRVQSNGLVARDNSVGGAGPMTNTFIRSPAYGGGPIPGLASSPWWVELVLYQPDAAWIPGSGEWYACQCDFETTMGWGIHSYDRKHFRAVLGAPGGAVLVSTYLATDATVGHHVVHLVFTGNQYTLYIDGILRASSAVGLAHTPDTGDPLMLSGLRRNSPVYPIYNRSVVGLSTGNTAITQEEITAGAAASLAAKKPTGIPTKTAKLWSVADDIVEAKGRVPTFVKERMADGATDRLMVVGTPLQVSLRRERAWGFEKNAIFTGLTGFSASNYLSTTNGICSGFLGGFFVTIAYIVYAQTTNATSVLVSTRSGGVANSGYQLHMAGTNTTLWGQVGMGTSDKLTNTVSVPAANNGRVCFVTYSFTQANASASVFYNLHNAVGGNTGTTDFVPSVGTPFTVGGRTDGHPVNDTSILGVAYGEGHLGVADHAALYENFASQEVFPRHRRYKHIWDFHQLIKANNGALPASFVDSVSGAALNVVGTLSLNPIYHRGYAL